MDDKFKVGKKWFWLAIIAGILNSLVGIIFAIALLFEREHRKEGWIVLLATILGFFIMSFVVGYLIQIGVLEAAGYPKYNYEFPIQSQ